MSDVSRGVGCGGGGRERLGTWKRQMTGRRSSCSVVAEQAGGETGRQVSERGSRQGRETILAFERSVVVERVVDRVVRVHHHLHRVHHALDVRLHHLQHNQQPQGQKGKGGSQNQWGVRGGGARLCARLPVARIAACCPGSWLPRWLVARRGWRRSGGPRERAGSGC